MNQGPVLTRAAGQPTKKRLDSFGRFGDFAPMMEAQLETERLRLRPLVTEDAPTIARLAGRREIADTTISIPHPYSIEAVREWIATANTQESPSKQAVFAITLKPDDQLIGAVGLRDIDPHHAKAELGIWVAVESWGKGYATEAVPPVLAYGFSELKLNRIEAHHMVRNPASGRVLENAGMRREGLLRQFVCKWGVFEDVVLLAILRQDWLATTGLPRAGIPSLP